jgi:CO/xanthine dehydrogenase Mo-binding subunit
LLASAAELLGVEDLTRLKTQQKTIFLEDNPEKTVSFSQAIQASVLKRNGNPIIGKGSFKGYPRTERYPSLAKGKGLFTGAYGFAAQAAEVEVDTFTGQVKLVKAVTFHDCGFPLNKTIVEGQIHGCASMGAGQALSEEIYLEKGQLFNASFLSYQLPISLDTPESVEGLVATIEPSGPFGAKEVGEGCVAGILGAIANAVHDAVGVRIYSLPITPEKVLRALDSI